MELNANRQLNHQYNTNKDTYISINNELKPKLIAQIESMSVVTPGKKCDSILPCPLWLNHNMLWNPLWIYRQCFFNY